jgi:long-chain fatty acid transport protein
MADLTWTNWSTFDELRVEFDSGLPDDVTEENWKDTWRLAVGTTYTPNTRWAWRAGLAYDQDPIPDARHRTPRIPSADRFWAALGVGYRPVSWLGVDVGYAHLFVKDADIDRRSTNPEDRLRGSLKGTYDLSADIVSAQLTATF